MTAISKVEKVGFECWGPHNFVFKSILEQCTNLQELTIGNIPSRSEIFKTFLAAAGTTSEIIIAAANKIKLISISPAYACRENWDKQIMDDFMEFILKLPKLEEIRLDGRLDKKSAAVLEAGLRAYLQKYKAETVGAFRLKVYNKPNFEPTELVMCIIVVLISHLKCCIEIGNHKLQEIVYK